MFEITNGILTRCNCSDEIITLPNDVKEIGYKAFSLCKAKEIIINNGLTSISPYAFFGSEIKEIILPETLKHIGDYAFANCHNLSSMRLNDGLETIGCHAFSSTGFKRIDIPSSVKEIATNPFINCSKLSEIKVDQENQYYSSCNNSNMICEKATGKIISGCKCSIIDNTIIEIGEDAFNGSGLQEIIIPDGVVTIGCRCFSNNSLKDINTNKVTNIYDGAFSDNISLEKIYLSDNLKIINSTIITRCDNLKEIILPKNVELICEDSFYNFLGTKVIIPENIKVIEEKAFSYCYRLKVLDFSGTKDQWLNAIDNRNVFYDTKNPREYKVNCLDGELTVPIFNK